MSGKKKNRNKVKRTGTQGQGQTAPVAEKAAKVVLDSDETTNGNSDHAEPTTEVSATKVDDIEAEVEQSEVDTPVEEAVNGESSDSHALEGTHSSSVTDVHTNDVAAAAHDDSTAASTTASHTNDTENHTSEAKVDEGSTQEENHRVEDSDSVVDPIQAPTDSSPSSSDQHQESPVDASEIPVKSHSRQSSSSSSKSSKSSKSDLQQEHPDSNASALVDVSTASSNGHHEAVDTSTEPTEDTIEPEVTTSSIANSVRTAMLADADDEDSYSKPSHSRISSSTSDRVVTAERTESSSRYNRRDTDTNGVANSSSSQPPAMDSSTETRTEPRSSRRPISRVSSSSSSSSDASLEEFKRELPASSSVSAGPRASFKPLEPFSYNTSISDDEDDEEAKKATERATERRAKAKARAATDKVEEELLDARETIQSLKKRLARSEAETEAARDETTSAAEMAAQIKLELEMLRKKHTDAVVFREESESDARKWRQRAEILQGELELVKFTEKKLAETAKALREAKDQLEAERAARDDLETSLKAAAHDREELIHAHQRELASAKRAQEVTQAAANAQLLEEREKATEAIRFVKSKLKAQIRELELLLEDKRDNDGESRSERRRLEREVRRLEEKIELESAERAKEARSSESSKRQLELLKDRVNKLTVDKLDLETLVLQEKRKFDALNADYDRATATIRALQAQVEQNSSFGAKAPRAHNESTASSSNDGNDE